MKTLPFTTRKSSHGFTIVELLVATLVFSTVLIIVTTGIIKIGQKYYKNLTISRTQESVRSVTDSISYALELADAEKQNGPDASKQFCISDTRYTYNRNVKVDSTNPPGTYALMSEKLQTGKRCDDPAAGTGQKELLGDNMRILDFGVDNFPVGSATWHIYMRVAYGDNDLLTHYNDNGSPNGWGGSDPNVDAVKNAECKAGNAGSQFCAVARLDTLVKRRLN